MQLKFWFISIEDATVKRLFSFLLNIDDMQRVAIGIPF